MPGAHALTEGPNRIPSTYIDFVVGPIGASVDFDHLWSERAGTKALALLAWGAFSKNDFKIADARYETHRKHQHHGSLDSYPHV